MAQDPIQAHPQPPQPRQEQRPPGTTAEMNPAPDHGERSYRGSGRLAGKAAIPRMAPGSTIVNTTSINAKSPSPSLLAYAATKGAIANFTAGLAQTVAGKGIRVNGVAPGPVWTPLIPSTMPPEASEKFGQNTPMGRAAQPAELAPPYVMLPSGEPSYITGALIPVTGGRPML